MRLHRSAILLIALTLQTTWGADQADRAYHRGDFPEAISRYIQEKERDSLNAVNRYNLGTAMLGAGLYSEAAEELQQATATADSLQMAQIHYNLGNALYRQGSSSQQPQEKIELWKKALASWRQTVRYHADHRNAKYNIELVQKKLQNELEQQQEQNDNDQQNKEDNHNRDNGSSDQQQGQSSSNNDQGGSSEQQGEGQSSQEEGGEQSSDSTGGANGGASSSSAAGDDQRSQPQPEAGSSEQESQLDESAAEPQPEAGEMTADEARQLLDSFADEDHKERGKPVRVRRGVERDW